MIQEQPSFDELILKYALPEVIVVIGGACVDEANPIGSLVPGQKAQLVGSRTKTTGGGASNVAVVKRSISPAHQVALFAQRGADDDGEWLAQSLAEKGVTMPLEPVTGMATSRSIVLTERTGQATIVTDPFIRQVPLPMALLEEWIATAAAVCVVAHAVNAELRPILELASKHAVRAFLGLGGAQIHSLGYDGVKEALEPGCAMVICNAAEAETLTRLCANDGGFGPILEALRFDGRAERVVVTNGAKGLVALDEEGRYWEIPAYSDPVRPVVDDTGCGDATQATIIHYLLRGAPMEIALRAGVRQGFEAATGMGATICLLNEPALDAYLSDTRRLAA